MTQAVTRVLRCVAIVSLVMVAACMDGSPTSSGGGGLVGDKSTKVVHYRSCSLLPNEMNWVSFSSCSEARSQGYWPCLKCNACR